MHDALGNRINADVAARRWEGVVKQIAGGAKRRQQA